MRIHITGTTKGLGKAIKGYADLRGWVITAFDKPEHDLGSSIDSFVSNDFDVYINNAYHGWTQTDLLYKLWEANHDRPCKIICVGSVVADRLYDRVYPYAIHKLALSAACKQLQQIDSYCKITHIKLGRMDTDMVSHRSGPKMDTAEVARQIGHIIDMPYGYVVKELALDNDFTPEILDIRRVHHAIPGHS